MTVFIVTGPPGAGKTTWVQNNADPDDVIVDFDALVAAMHTGGGGRPSSLVWRTAMAARDAAIRKVLSRDGHVMLTVGDLSIELDAYVIHAVPNRDQIRRYLDQGARILIVDPGRGTVIERLTAAGRLDEVHTAVMRWYDETLDQAADVGTHVIYQYGRAQ